MLFSRNRGNVFFVLHLCGCEMLLFRAGNDCLCLFPCFSQPRCCLVRSSPIRSLPAQTAVARTTRTTRNWISPAPQSENFIWCWDGSDWSFVKSLKAFINVIVLFFFFFNCLQMCLCSTGSLMRIWWRLVEAARLTSKFLIKCLLILKSKTWI